MKTTISRIFIIMILLFIYISSYSQLIDVLSFNIRYGSFNDNIENWDQRKEGVISVIRGHDFVGLQEVLPVQMKDIAAGTSTEYASLFRTREADPSQGEGCPVLYNKNRWEVIDSGHFWLSGTPLTVGSNTWGAAYNRMVTFGLFHEVLSGDRILVINTHFDHISQSAREKSIELILDRFSREMKEIPVVFMGDLNVTPDNPVYEKIMAGNNLTDSFLAKKQPKKTSGATFHGWKPETPTDRIDFIFVSSFLKVKSCKVLHTKYNGNYPSDHFPVLAILCYKK